MTQDEKQKKRVSICVDLSKAVYENEEKLSAYLTKKYSKNFKIIKDKNDFCVVLKYYNVIYIAVRGTDDGADVLADLNFFPRNDKDLGWVHRGFYNAANQLEHHIIAAISQLKGVRCRMYFTGHSLGGAVSCLLAVMFKLTGFNVQGVYTFGAPKPGKGSFKKIFRECIVESGQYMFSRDPVPQVPRSYMFWKHPGDTHTLVKNQNRGWGFLWFGKAEEHKIDGYYTKLF